MVAVPTLCVVHFCLTSKNPLNANLLKLILEFSICVSVGHKNFRNLAQKR